MAADEAGIPREDLRYAPVRNGSPYTEVTREFMNKKGLESYKVEFNPLYRFSGVFSNLFDINLEGYETTRQLFIEIVMQYLIQLDLRQGLSRQEYALRFLLRDLLGGVCGGQAARVVEHFEKEKIRRLLRLVLKLYQCGSSIYLFKEVIRCMYSGSLVYASNEAVCQVLVYIGQKETEKEREQVEFLRDMFLPVHYQVYLFWEHHFGIIGVEETMELDEMVLF